MKLSPGVRCRSVVRMGFKHFFQLVNGFSVRARAKRCGRGLKVNRPSTVTRFTELGNNVNFNGIRISGRGPVKIGNNFHSGRDCVILTSSHDYDSGEAIPYGSATIDRPVIIEDNVWIGERVIILGGSFKGRLDYPGRKSGCRDDS